MKTVTFKNDGLTVAALMLTLPATYIILIGLLKYAFGIDGPFDSAQPVLENWGIKDPPGLNITSLVLFGPVAAFLLTIFQVLGLEWNITREEFHLHLTLQKRWFPLLVAAFSAGLLALLTFYLLVENYNHP